MTFSFFYSAACIPSTSSYAAVNRTVTPDKLIVKPDDFIGDCRWANRRPRPAKSDPFRESVTPSSFRGSDVACRRSVSGAGASVAARTTLDKTTGHQRAWPTDRLVAGGVGVLHKSEMTLLLFVRWRRAGRTRARPTRGYREPTDRLQQLLFSSTSRRAVFSVSARRTDGRTDAQWI